MNFALLLLASIILCGTTASAAVVRRELVVEKGDINLSGRKAVGFVGTQDGPGAGLRYQF